MKCDRCPAAAVFTVTAAYPACDVTHPHFATYPAPLGRACAGHTVDIIARDRGHAGATPAYLVRPL